MNYEGKLTMEGGAFHRTPLLVAAPLVPKNLPVKFVLLQFHRWSNENDVSSGLGLQEEHSA